MTLEKRELGFLRVRMMPQGAVVFPAVVCRPRLLCLADLAKQIVFLSLQVVVAGLQCFSSIFGCFLFSQNRVVLCCRILSFTLGLFLLFLIHRIICSFLRGVCAGLLLVIMKAILNLFRKF